MQLRGGLQVRRRKDTRKALTVFGTAISPWFSLLAVVVCVVLAVPTVQAFTRASEKPSYGAWTAAAGSTLFLVLALMIFFFGKTADEATPTPMTPEGQVEINSRAPDMPTPDEIKKETTAKDKEVFKETNRDIRSHVDEADDIINKAIKKAGDEK